MWQQIRKKIDVTTLTIYLPRNPYESFNLHRPHDSAAMLQISTRCFQWYTPMLFLALLSCSWSWTTCNIIMHDHDHTHWTNRNFDTTLIYGRIAGKLGLGQYPGGFSMSWTKQLPLCNTNFSTWWIVRFPQSQWIQVIDVRTWQVIITCMEETIFSPCELSPITFSPEENHLSVISSDCEFDVKKMVADAIIETELTDWRTYSTTS